ncbi:hypothetical protein [Bacillus toyonensis]|uniref:Uncharacterized protein n=1 Tax=Bacillus toyonensis TaxID=155322 RepID=A0A2A8HJI5_9BACI|nr:hypothetical protein [Bacillus toyonensis]PEQ09148.1 hypothetical protein CN585_05700 [Bacillus toyonensis]
MLINLNDFRRRKQQSEAKKNGTTAIPVFDRIFIENDEWVGELAGSKRKVVIEELDKKKH